MLRRRNAIAQRHRHFLAAWMRSPLKIGALVPSSRGLAREMAAHVEQHKPGAVIELGAGTGVVTQALLQAGIAPERLVVIERDPRLYGILCAHFPHLRVLQADAAELDAVLAQENIRAVSAIVSSLPLMSMPKAVRTAIIGQMGSLAARHNARIIQFTYGPQSPIHAHHQHRHSLHGKRVRFVIKNVPPAHVWVYGKM